jgi:HEPN domain-containing protein
MKQTTKDWLTVAEDDFLAAKTLAREDRLTNLATFHCQQ